MVLGLGVDGHFRQSANTTHQEQTVSLLTRRDDIVARAGYDFSLCLTAMRDDGAVIMRKLVDKLSVRVKRNEKMSAGRPGY